VAKTNAALLQDVRTNEKLRNRNKGIQEQMSSMRTLIGARHGEPEFIKLNSS
jgi:hypothetical protein